MQGSYLEVSSQQSNWRQFAPLDETVLYISSQPGDAVLLPETDALGEQGRLLVRPRGEGYFGYLLYNLSDVPVNYQPYLNVADNLPRRLAYGDHVALSDRDRVTFGNFQLIYLVGDHELSDLEVEIRLDGNSNRLTLHQPLSGQVIVKSSRDQPIQPVVDVILGDHKETKIGPLASDPEDAIPIRFELRHPKSTTPPPGAYKVVFQVRAPKIDPNKFAVRTLMIQIDPYPHHHIYLQPHVSTRQRPNWTLRLVNRMGASLARSFGFFRVHNGRSG